MDDLRILFVWAMMCVCLVGGGVLTAILTALIYGCEIRLKSWLKSRIKFKFNDNWGQNHLGHKLFTPFEAHIFDMTILFEKHEMGDTCSYCKTFPGHVGLKLPEDRGKNSWRVLYFRTDTMNYYLRWTLPKWKIKYPDPVQGCELYQEEGCAHVDGLLCDFPECSMLKEWKNK